MRMAVPRWRFQFQAQMEGLTPEAPDPSPRRGKPLLDPANDSVKEIGELQLPGLTDELRYTWLALKEEIAIEASRWGGSPTYFLPISWARWKEMLGINSLNAIKTRLARLEDLGLIEVQPAERGSWGTSLNCYRLRVENEPLAFKSVMEARELFLARRRKERERQKAAALTCMAPWPTAAEPPLTRNNSRTDSPLIYEPVMADIPQTGTLQRIGQTDTPPIEEIELSTPVQINSITKIGIELNGLIEVNSIKKNKSIDSIHQFQSINSINEKNQFPFNEAGRIMKWQVDNRLCDRNFDFLLKEPDPEPWSDSLILALGEILDPQSLPSLERRSPWRVQGAWAILESVRVNGRKLGNQPGTLWNALAIQKSGEDWLAKIIPAPGTADWLRTSGDMAVERAFKAPLPERNPNIEDFAPRKPLPLRAGGNGIRSYALETYQLRGGVAAGSEGEMVPIPPIRYRLRRPEEFSPMLKTHLRLLIEECQEALRFALGAPAAEKMDAFEAFSQTFQYIQGLLEPMLPFQVRLPDQYRSTEIRDRSHIKLDVLNGVYGAIS
jgi:hypothetical protein